MQHVFMKDFFILHYLTKKSQKEYHLLNKLSVLSRSDVILFVLFVLFEWCGSTTDVLFKDLYGRNKVKLFKKKK